MKRRRGNVRISLYEPSGRGGVCHYTYELAEHLWKAGADVTLITTEDFELAHLDRHFTVEYLFTRSWLTRLRGRISRPSTSKQDSVPAAPEKKAVRSTRLRALRLRFLHLQAAARFLTQRPDVVHFQWLANREQDFAFMKLLSRMGIPSVYTAHDVEPHLTASAKDRAELGKLYGAAAKVIVHAESNKKELVKVFGIPEAKVAVIPHGSYDFLCALEPVSRDAARKKIGIPESKKVVLFFGLIKRYKGLEYLVEAFQEVRSRLETAFLLIVGDIYAGDATSHRYYSEMIESLRGRDDVLCIASYVPVESVSQYLSAADVVVLPYTRTYQSGVLLAAYAAGRPVVVTNTGGLAEVVEEGKSGFVVPPEDARALANAIVEILRDSGRLDAMGRRARHLATAVYGWEAIAAKTIELYRSVLGEAA